MLNCLYDGCVGLQVAQTAGTLPAPLCLGESFCRFLSFCPLWLSWQNFDPVLLSLSENIHYSWGVEDGYAYFHLSCCTAEAVNEKKFKKISDANAVIARKRRGERKERRTVFFFASIQFEAFFVSAVCTSMHGPTLRGTAWLGLPNSRSCPTQARPDEKLFYIGPARARPCWCT